MKIQRSWYVLLSLVTMCGFPGGARAQPFAWWAATTVPPGLDPNDAHPVFAGTGGTVAAVAWDPVNSTAPPPIAIGPNLAANGVDIVWAAKLIPGDVVAFTFTTMFAPVVWADGNWTNGGFKIAQIDGGGSRIAFVMQDVLLNLKGAATDIGNIFVSIPGTTNVMEARFEVDPMWKNLSNWIDFHWVQIITVNTCVVPATTPGIRIAGVAPPLPVVDTPANGWDYMYMDLDDPADGIQADERVPGNTKGAEWDDDAVDTLPWYLTVVEEGTKNVIGQTYDLWDTKGCPGVWLLMFETWLVAETATDELCLIRGFSWGNGSAGVVAPVDLGVPDAADATRVGDGLTHGNIVGWTVNAKCDVENCFAVCKDGASDGTFAVDESACHLQCDTFCGLPGPPNNAAVEACFFKGENIKGGVCQAFCKDGSDQAGPAQDQTDCHSECDSFCGDNLNVLACFFKGENIKGGVCEAVCKDGRAEAVLAQDQTECHSACDTFCGLPGPPNNAAVEVCAFKTEKVKANCEVACKPDPSATIHLQALTQTECRQLCDATCGTGSDDVYSCYFAGRFVAGNIPTVSQWGLVVLSLLVAAAATVVIMRRRAMVRG